eukprot:scaffold66328_cov26-Tisochrysis_lutea.AAC.1
MAAVGMTTMGHTATTVFPHTSKSLQQQKGYTYSGHSHLVALNGMETDLHALQCSGHDLHDAHGHHHACQTWFTHLNAVGRTSMRQTATIMPATMPKMIPNIKRFSVRSPSAPQACKQRVSKKQHNGGFRAAQHTCTHTHTTPASSGCISTAGPLEQHYMGHTNLQNTWDVQICKNTHTHTHTQDSVHRHASVADTASEVTAKVPPAPTRLSSGWLIPHIP